jgi:CubicO group peptidase (beta-lactamase class C family)
MDMPGTAGYDGPTAVGLDDLLNSHRWSIGSSADDPPDSVVRFRVADAEQHALPHEFAIEVGRAGGLRLVLDLRRHHAESVVTTTAAGLRSLLLGDEESRLRAWYTGGFEHTGKRQTMVQLHFALVRTEQTLVEPAANDRSYADALQEFPRVARWLDAELELRSAGVQVSVDIAGSTLIELGAGLARPGLGMTAETPTVWLCAAKPLTAVAILQLAEQGLVDLARPVADVLPYMATGGKQMLTFIDLLTHSSGIEPESDPLKTCMYDPAEVRRERLAEFVVPTGTTPGTRHTYGYMWSWFVLAEAIEAISGTSYLSYLKEHVLDPCAMTRTWLQMTEHEYSEVSTRLGGLWERRDGGYAYTHLNSSRQACTSPIPGTDVFGPVGDLTRFYRVLLQDLCGAGRLLGPDTAAQMTSRVVGPFPTSWPAGPGEWGLGVRLESKRLGRPSVYNGLSPSSSTFGFEGMSSTKAMADPVAGVVVSFTVNGLLDRNPHRRRVIDLVDSVYQDATDAGYLTHSQYE